MTSSVETEFNKVFDEVKTLYEDIEPVHRKNEAHRHILRSKENIYKHKCKKLLKKKLKKYKLRQDGKEDQDVLDVSNILVSSLVIKSPNFRDSVKEGDIHHFQELRPKNYLFKMGRRKGSIKISSSVKNPSLENKQDTIEMSESKSQEKKHTNAFKLLMDSRCKSIGSNSPGKEKSDDQSDNDEMLEKKNLKAKRNLLLQKMANAKGYLKNKEIEEYEDKIIKRKMDERAERLKSMIQNSGKPIEEYGNSVTKAKADSHKSHSKDEKVTNNNDLKKQPKSFKIIDIFNTLNDPILLSPEKQDIPKEDKEFLKKLSPSLKKKESMLSYFKKVDKEPELSIDEENDTIIKVKLQVKPKKKGKRKKLSLKKDTVVLSDPPEGDNGNDVVVITSDPQTLEVIPVCSEETEVKSNSERQKRKRNSKLNKVHSLDATELDNESRPKRSIKRPVKYIDDVYLSSSDEDLHIFTPKKKKHVDNNDKIKINSHPKQIVSDAVKPKEKKVIKETNTPKKPVKLAPIFASKQMDPAALEAKQKFLQSGVPEKLKRIIQQQKNHNKISNDFPIIVHVQQIDSATVVQNTQFLNLIDDTENICPLVYEDNVFKKLLNLNQPSNTDITIDNCKKSTQLVLQNLKQLHPKFPVYRTYRYLRGKGKIKDCNIEFDNSIEVINDVADISNDNPDRLNWTDKYKAMSTNQIIGNFESIKELRKWLVSWNEIKSTARANAGSDSSDYYQSETDSRDSFKSVNNLLILTGPTGCGKTSSIYAVAADLAMKVIEVNASSKRTGKIMLQDLQEATQSHKVNRGTGTDSSQKSQEKSLTELLKRKREKKRGRPKKSADSTKNSAEQIEVSSSTPSSQESVRTDMSLILIDDADIIFEQDDGFSSAIVQLVQCSKRPVILITSSLLCPHLQRFIQNGKILKMCPLLPQLLGTWLDIMCLADSGISWPGAGAKFLNYFKGDIRKTINYLQFYVSSSANVNLEESSQNSDSYKSNIDDENSSMSWVDHEDLESKKLMPILESNPMWMDFVDKHSNLTKLTSPIHLFDIWWSVPNLLNYTANASNTTEKTESQIKTQKLLELEALADTIDAISLADYMNPVERHSRPDITSDPWYTPEYDSVCEQDNLDFYAKKYEVCDEICHTLVTGCVTAAQDVINCDRKADISFPGMSLQRERDKIVSRHNNLTTYLSPWATLDRRSLALDYWSSCRTICRIEKSKNDANISTKRNNRFCHYLRSLSVLCKSESFDNLCDSLSNQGTKFNIPNVNKS